MTAMDHSYLDKLYL